MAADSAVTLQSPHPEHPEILGVVQTFEFASKVTQLKDYPIGVMSWGAAGIGARTIQSLIMEFENDFDAMEKKPNYEVESIARELFEFIAERYDQPVGTLGMLVGGYSADQFFPDIYELGLPQETDQLYQLRRPDLEDGQPNFGADWFGEVDPLSRLIKGMSQELGQALVEKGVALDLLNSVVGASPAPGEAQIVFVGMPIQDAIDLAQYLADVVVGYKRFCAGPPTSGGAIDIAVIRPNDFAWAQRKRWSIKQEETQ